VIAMGLYDTVTVDVLSAAFQTKQLGEGMLTYHLGPDGRLAAPCGALVAFHGLLHLVGEDGAEFMATFTHGELAGLVVTQELCRRTHGSRVRRTALELLEHLCTDWPELRVVGY
jgi:hypothetical protein